MTKRVLEASVWTPRRLVADLLAGRRHLLCVGLGLLLIGQAASVAVPLLARALIDGNGWSQPHRVLWQLSAWVLLAALLQAAGKYFSARMVSVGAQAAIARLRERLHAHALALPMRHYQIQAVGSLTSRVMQDVDAVRVLLGSGLLQMVGAVFTALLALIVLFWLHWALTLSVLAVLLLVGALLAVLFARSRPLVKQRMDVQNDLNARCTESLASIRLIRAYAMEPVVQRQFVERSAALFGTIRSSLQLSSWMSVVTVLAIALLSVLALQIGGRAVISGALGAGDMVAYGILVGLLASPLATLANLGSELGEALASLDRMSGFLSLPAESSEADGASASIPRLEGHIEFREVSFAYDAEHPVLEKVSFVLPAGSLTAIVGLSGAGKSTLLSLLMGMERPQSGQILIDQQDLQELPDTAYRKQLGVVLQEDALFEGTLLDNIRFGVPQASLAAVADVCQRAHVDEFSARLPNGLDTWVGVNGQRLSGGQRQRVAIARALLRDPAILILDEATSQLDVHSEAMVQAGLRTLRAGRTTVVVAHRPSTLELADQILAVEQGRVRLLRPLNADTMASPMPSPSVRVDHFSAPVSDPPVCS